MTRTNRRAAVAGVVLLLASPALGDQAAQRGVQEEGRGVVIGTGAISGIYYQAGNAICRLVERDERSGQPAAPALPCGALMTGGSVRNVVALRAGQIDAALIQSDVLDQAVRGTGAFKDRSNDKLRALFSLYGEPYQFLVLRGLGVRAFGDLKGRKVNLGQNGTAPNETFRTLMRRHDLTESSFAQVQHLAVSDQVAAFCDGDVEALGMMVGTPFAPYKHAIDHCGGDLLGLDTDIDRKLIADTPGYASVVIPRDTYPGIDRDVVTFGVVAVAVVTSDTPEPVAYRIVRSVFDRIDDLRAMHPALAGLDPKHMVADGITAPLHPGALRYFRERHLLP